MNQIITDLSKKYHALSGLKKRGVKGNQTMMTTAKNPDKLIIANCSGFFGDRFSAAKEMVKGGPVHVLTGDYLAELTMAILFQKKLKDPNAGYVQTFLDQMKEVIGLCMEKNIKVVSNAGGLNPSGLAQALKALTRDMGLSSKIKIAYIEGDDLMPRMAELQNEKEHFIHLDKEISLKESGAMPITANAYMGCWGIAEALKAGADIVVTGRVADAALAAGPAAWHFGWQQKDFDKLAGAYAAGHIIECGAQCTGGNYSFIDEVPSFSNVGFPLTEIFKDGSFVITKHPNTGGLVSVGTVTAQLLYEIEKPAYLTPDVIVRFDTIELLQEGQDRVKGSGVKGCPPTDTLKVCINTLGGYKNTMTVVLTGLDIEKKAKIVEECLLDSIGGRETFSQLHTELIRSDKENPVTNEQAFAFLRITVMDPDHRKVGKLFSSKVVELALANIPGFTLTALPGKGSPFVVHWPALISADKIKQKIVIDEDIHIIEAVSAKPFDIPKPLQPLLPEVSFEGKTVPAPLGTVFASRAGDKGGNANLAVWAKTPEAFVFLQKFMTVEKLKDLLPDCASFAIDRYELPNLFALNFYIRGILGEGAAASLRSDPQAKTLGEYLRAKVVDLPEAILRF